MRKTRNSGCGEGQPAPVVPPSPGSASWPSPQALLSFVGSARRAGSLAACLQLLQFASVNLDLIDSHLDQQDVTDDAVLSMLPC